MKAVGATRLQIVRLYLTVVVIFGVVAVLVAVPLGVVSAHLVGSWLLDMFNVTVQGFRFASVAVASRSVWDSPSRLSLLWRRFSTRAHH